MLTDNQQQALNLYYNEDLSLSEIAEQHGITRQGVRDTIQKAQTQLFDLEKKLCLSQKFKDTGKKVQAILECASKISLETNLDVIKSLANEIKDVVVGINKEM